MKTCRAYKLSPQSTLAVVIVNHSTERGFSFFFLLFKFWEAWQMVLPPMGLSDIGHQNSLKKFLSMVSQNSFSKSAWLAMKLHTGKSFPVSIKHLEVFVNCATRTWTVLGDAGIQK